MTEALYYFFSIKFKQALSYTVGNTGRAQGITRRGENGNIEVMLSNKTTLESSDGNNYDWSLGAHNNNVSVLKDHLIFGIMDYSITIFHESYIHVDLNAKDYSDNGVFDFSNISKEAKDWNRFTMGDKDTRHLRHIYVRDFKGSSMWPNKALRGIIEVNSKLGNLYTKDQLSSQQNLI